MVALQTEKKQSQELEKSVTDFLRIIKNKVLKIQAGNTTLEKVVNEIVFETYNDPINKAKASSYDGVFFDYLEESVQNDKTADKKKSGLTLEIIKSFKKEAMVRIKEDASIKALRSKGFKSDDIISLIVEKSGGLKAIKDYEKQFSKDEIIGFLIRSGHRPDTLKGSMFVKDSFFSIADIDDHLNKNKVNPQEARKEEEKRLDEEINKKITEIKNKIEGYKNSYQEIKGIKDHGERMRKDVSLYEEVKKTIEELESYMTEKSEYLAIQTRKEDLKKLIQELEGCRK